MTSALHPPHHHPPHCCSIKSAVHPQPPPTGLQQTQLQLELTARLKKTDDNDRPGDLDGDHHRRVPEVLGKRRRQTQTEEERAEGSAQRRAAGSDRACERPGYTRQPDGEPGRRRRRRVRLPGVHDIHLHGYRLLPRVLRARGRVKEEEGEQGDKRGGATVNYKEGEEA